MCVCVYVTHTATGEMNSRPGEGEGLHLPPGTTPATSMNPDEVLAIETLLSRQLVKGLISLLVEVPLV